LTSPTSISAPLDESVVKQLKSGDRVLISGTVYSLRDAAHKQLIELIDHNKSLPFDLSGAIVYYMGPCPAQPQAVIGSAGPTTASRMDAYTPKLLERGLKGMIGKGSRSQEVKDAIKKYKAVYFGAVGGLGAFLSKRIKKAEVIAFAELGPEAIRRLEIENFPAVVINDPQGGDLHQEVRSIS